MNDYDTNRYVTETCDSCGPQRTWHVSDTKRMLRYFQYQQGKVRCPQCQLPMDQLEEHIVTPPSETTTFDGGVFKYLGEDYILDWQQWLPTLRAQVLNTCEFVKWSDSKTDNDREALENSLTRFDSFLHGEFLNAVKDDFNLSPLLIYAAMLINRLGGRWNDSPFMADPSVYTDAEVKSDIYGSVHVYLEDCNTDLPFRGPL